MNENPYLMKVRMHFPDTEPATRTVVAGRFRENASPETNNTATIESFVWRLLTNCAGAIKKWLRQSKTHYYHICDLGTYFFLEESTEFADEVYITSYQSLVEPIDLVKIEYASEVTTYRILELQHYSNSPNICVARLKPIPSDSDPGQA